MKRKLAVLLVCFSTMSCIAYGSDSANRTEEPDKNESGNAVSNESVEPDEPDDIFLNESGYSVVNNSFGDVYVYWGATVSNPNANVAASFPVITVTAKGEDGAIISTNDQTLFYIAPEDTVSYGGFIDCNGTAPANVEITSTCSSFVPDGSDDVVKTSDFVISNTSEIAGDFGETTYTGEIENIGNNNTDLVVVTLILKNNGEIVYGDTTFVDSLTPGTKKAFEISEYDLPKHTEYIISAQSW